MRKLKDVFNEIPENQRVPSLALALIIGAKNKDIPEDQYVDYIQSAMNATKIDASRITINKICSALSGFIQEDRKTALEQISGLLLAMVDVAAEHRERELRILANLHELIYSETKS